MLMCIFNSCVEVADVFLTHSLQLDTVSCTQHTHNTTRLNNNASQGSTECAVICFSKPLVCSSVNPAMWGMAYSLMKTFATLTGLTTAVLHRFHLCWMQQINNVPFIHKGGVVPGEYFLVSTKLDTFCYPTVQTAPCYVLSFWHNTGVWRTDRRTDGQTDGQTELL